MEWLDLPSKSDTYPRVFRFCGSIPYWGGLKTKYNKKALSSFALDSAFLNTGRGIIDKKTIIVYIYVILPGTFRLFLSRRP